MVIQRWQSVLLLVAAVAMALFTFLPFATVESLASAQSAITVAPCDFAVYFVLNITISLLLFIAIFLYKNIRRQMTVTLLSLMLIAVSAVTGLFIVFGHLKDASLVLGGGVLLLIVALVAALWGYRRIKADHKLLTSMDRIR